MTLVKMIRQTLFSSTVIGIRIIAVEQWGTEIELYSKFNKEMWECIAKEQARGQWIVLNKIQLSKF